MAVVNQYLGTFKIEQGSIPPYLSIWYNRSAGLKRISVNRPSCCLLNLHPAFGPISSGSWQGIIEIAVVNQNLGTFQIEQGSILPYLSKWYNRPAFLKLISVNRPSCCLFNLHPGCGPTFSGSWQSIIEMAVVNKNLGTFQIEQGSIPPYLPIWVLAENGHLIDTLPIPQTYRAKAWVQIYWITTSRIDTGKIQTSRSIMSLI